MSEQPTCGQIVRDESGSLALCDKPLPDTARICPACVRRMRATLSRCVDLWPHVEAAVGRSLRLGGVPGTGSRTVTAQSLVGPTCASCDHASCVAIWKRRTRGRNEPPIPNEEPLLLNPDALEDAWAVENTLTTWARLLSEETGEPIPPLRARMRAEPPQAPPLVADERCEFSDLPTKPRLQCACNHPRRSHP